MIPVPRCTAEMLPKNVLEGYKKKGMKFLLTNFVSSTNEVLLLLIF